MKNISPDKLSAIISLVVAIIILVANYFQWWSITYDGGMVMSLWVKILIAILIVALALSLYLLFLNR